MRILLFLSVSSFFGLDNTAIWPVINWLMILFKYLFIHIIAMRSIEQFNIVSSYNAFFRLHLILFSLFHYIPENAIVMNIITIVRCQ